MKRGGNIVGPVSYVRMRSPMRPDDRGESKSFTKGVWVV